MSTFLSLQRRGLLRLERADGLAYLAIKEGINQARRTLAMVEDFEELQDRSTTAESVEDQKSYSAATDWLLTRCKDILGIVVVDGTSSQRLDYKSRSWIDEKYPYPEGLSTAKPRYYTKRGTDYELLLIPNDDYTLYIDYTQWPLELSDDDDENELTAQEDVIILLAADIAQAILNKEAVTNWTSRAQALLKGTTLDQRDRPDRRWVAQPFRATAGGSNDDYWLNPLTFREP